MSIFPRKFRKGETNSVMLHLRVRNRDDSTLKGKAVFEIEDPSGIEEKIVEDMKINPGEETDLYTTYNSNKFEKGKYNILGYFSYSEGRIVSNTCERDFFEVI